MADLAVAAVIRTTFDILGNLLVDEAVRFYWLKEDIRWIAREMRRMQSFLIDLDAKQSSSHGVANLGRDVRDLAYDVEDIIDTYIPKILSQNRKFLGWLTKKVNCLPCGSRHHFVMEIEGIRRRVDDINRCRITYGINENSASGGGEEGNPRQSFPHVDVPVVGFREHINALEARLLDTEIQFCVTSIIGMPGVGKTTLAKKVYNSVKANFLCSAWVYVSQEPKRRDLLQDIARQVGLEKEQREENLEANLFNFLKKKRYVIVIDDIWDVKAWDDVLINGIPNDCENQSRLVLTSRNRDVGLSVGGSSSLHELQPLNPEMSWELFSLIVKTPIEDTDQELMHLGEQILKKCGGLPLSIVTIAGLLSRKGVTEHAWRGVLNKMGEKKDEICALSYRDLPTDLKPCFLYFGIFPEDHNILARDLINLWVAEGFIQSQGKQTLEDAGEDNLNELLTRNLIQVEKRRYDGRIKSCRIHDVLHDLCISIAQEEGFFTTHRGNGSVTPTESRRAAIHQQGIYNGISSNHQFPKLRALLYFNVEKEIPPRPLNQIHKGFRLLCVLRLEGLEFGERLPKEIGILVHLRYFWLRGSNLILPATMGNLKNLQVLDCQECEGLILPTAIWKMDKLRHIYIPNRTKFARQPKFSHNISQIQVVEEVSLPNLQTLYTIDADILNADFFLQLTNLKNLGICSSMKPLGDIFTSLTHISEKLEKFQFMVWDDGLLQLPSQELPTLNFSCYQNLRELYLECPLRKLPNFSRSLTKLNLVLSELENDPMKELGMLPNLRVLKLRRTSYMGHGMVISGPDSFPRLEVLIIEPMPSLKELRVEDGDRVMPKLQKVKINATITLDIQSERLKGIFQEFNDYLMRQSFLELEVELNWPEDDDDVNWGEVYSPLEENEVIEPPTEVANKGREFITDEGTGGEITETRNTFELGECSSQDRPPK